MPFPSSVAAINTCSRMYYVCDKQQGHVNGRGAFTLWKWGVNAGEKPGYCGQEKKGATICLCQCRDRNRSMESLNCRLCAAVQ